MNAPQLQNKKGFTIIEVVLVLAIAALIFLMVFIALPALQRNQRDTARKTVLGKVTSAVTSYQSNHRGANPTTEANLAKYVDADASNVIDNEYTLHVDAYSALSGTGGKKGSAKADAVQVITGAKCDPATNLAIQGTSQRSAVAIIELENSGETICQDA
ncbi:type II secretion system protein [Candidatus Saccharibacteria bacterium]|nr:type II secretion system protein [Candidatus Saccharibacteria bacterium]